jgi:hypothetical protein
LPFLISSKALGIELNPGVGSSNGTSFLFSGCQAGTAFNVRLFVVSPRRCRSRLCLSREEEALKEEALNARGVFVVAVVVVVVILRRRKRLLFVFILKACKEEEEELEGTEDPEAFKEFRRLCAQESPHDDDDENDDAMILVVRGILVVPSARFCVCRSATVQFFSIHSGEKKGDKKKHV